MCTWVLLGNRDAGIENRDGGIELWSTQKPLAAFFAISTATSWSHDEYLAIISAPNPGLGNRDWGMGMRESIPDSRFPRPDSVAGVTMSLTPGRYPASSSALSIDSHKPSRERSSLDWLLR